MNVNINKLMAWLLLIAMLLSLSACSGSGKTDPDSPLSAFEEVREMNETLKMPLLLGASERTVKSKGFESYGNGIEHHIMRYRSKDAKDVTYTCGTRELYYNDTSSSISLYVTGFRIMPENKTIQKNDDGSTTPVYTTSRSVLGIKVGDMIDDAREILLSKGYSIVYEEPWRAGLPKTYEHSFRKGVIMFSIGAEDKGDISQISVWIPYYEPQISAMNEQSKLPADLGLIYSVVENSDFSYSGKSKTSRRYETEDGSVAIMRGFPDLIDMNMTAEISFVSDEYNVLGVTVGMTEQEAKELLIAKGCTENEEGLFVFNSVAAVQLTVENGVVTRIAATLRPSTNLAQIEVE